MLAGRIVAIRAAVANARRDAESLVGTRIEIRAQAVEAGGTIGGRIIGGAIGVANPKPHAVAAVRLDAREVGVRFPSSRVADLGTEVLAAEVARGKTVIGFPRPVGGAGARRRTRVAGNERIGAARGVVASEEADALIAREIGGETLQGSRAAALGFWGSTDRVAGR